MKIRLVTPLDQEAYAEFRRHLWPSHPAGGHWAALDTKYFRNPHAQLCPESGLYAYYNGSRILGIMGALPAPVTLGRTLHPGHMLVDWAVLPQCRFGPVAGQLWNSLVDLPGRKYASYGSRFSQGPLERRGVKIRTAELAGLILPSRAIAARLLGLTTFGYPSPVNLEALGECPGIALLPAREVRAARPAIPESAARVERDGSFWEVYCANRICNGAVAIRVESTIGSADVVLNLLEAGRFRFATLLAAHLDPYTPSCARSVGNLLGKALRSIHVCLLWATAVDREVSELVGACCSYVRRSRSHWWSIAKPTDTFGAHDVAWWLTAAERDSHFGGLQPYFAD